MLIVNLFGDPHIQYRDGQTKDIPSGKTLALFSYLLINPANSFERGVLASALRADTSEQLARRALSTDLWRLRTFFSECNLETNHYFSACTSKVALRAERIRLDVAEFVRTINTYMDKDPHTFLPEDVRRLEDAEAMFSDVFLPAIEDEWCFLYREKIRSKYIALLELLLAIDLSNDRWSSAIRWAEKLIRRDPLYEKAHRALIQCYYLSGERALAIRQYEKCARILREELNCAPDEKTQKMHRGLVSVQNQRGWPTLTTSGMHKIEDSPEPYLPDYLSRALANINQAGSLVALVDKKLRLQQQ